METNKKKSVLIRILAWFLLAIIVILLLVIAYALVTQNGRLAMAFIIGLIFISIVSWVVMKLYKDAEKYRHLHYEESEKQKMNDIANQNTKNI